MGAASGLTQLDLDPDASAPPGPSSASVTRTAVDTAGTIEEPKPASRVWADQVDDPQDTAVPMQVDSTASTSDSGSATRSAEGTSGSNLAALIAAGEDDRRLMSRSLGEERARSRSKSQPKSP